jgi:hypothetical protein
MNHYSPNDDQWAAARAKSQRVMGQPSIQTKNEGFFQRSRRKISQTLPLPAFHKAKDWRETEKLGRGRWAPGAQGGLSKLKTFVGNVLRKFKIVFIVLAIVMVTTIVFNQTGRSPCSGH